MKNYIIIANIISSILTTGYIGWTYLKLWGSGFNTTGGRSANQFEVVTIIILTVALILSLCFSYYYSNHRLLWAILPIIVFVIIQGIILVEYSQFKSRIATTTNQQKTLLESISKDFVYEGYHGAFNPDGTDNFITYDREHNVLVTVDVMNGERVGNVHPLGKIEDKNLKTFYNNPADYYDEYFNSSGKKISDLYTITYEPGQGEEEYYLGQYKLNFK